MSGLVLRLAGPLQSWGEHSVFAVRDTAGFPTRSGLIGLFAAAMGLSRGKSLTRFDDLRLTVRVDTPGVLLTDFHTVGGGLPAHRTVPTADAKRRPGDTGTIVTRRRYLSDAVFTVAVTGPDDILDTIGQALERPVWQPYLGRRSCPPDEPLMLRRRTADPEGDLRTRVPLPRRPRSRPGPDGLVEIDLLSETEPGDGRAALTELADVPESLDPLDRRYRRRAVYRQTAHLPGTLLAGPGRGYQQALYQYMRADQEQP
ncbi:CRISPR system Cascade subunit CasD [Parafrankia irregularis]|uniref:CRISPR system Cascade subunit CasD n=1 Tax=Parafrankia irregularis TaxID=795642 RepID=A0A0S4QLP7_9ACTN|nr:MULTISPECIES: type I-E CRISPR-associated protein Cas5/CasD [Parafrankia]MBE3200225.1 type I-E CRISPR-associated protein Cas5/CasD [Parafrankia sp. CH37]CUU56581.1 CRISPR system Cascade subunit CasD [Parafrankia irregularis]